MVYSGKFVSEGAPDGSGFRPEIGVEKGRGKVKSIAEMQRVARIQFDGFKPNGDPLQHPVLAGIQIDDPVYEIIKAAKSSGDIVEYRIESHRKRDVDPKIPHAELAKEATKNLTRIIAAINDQPTSEAVTNPKEDERFAPSDARRRVTDEDIAGYAAHQPNESVGSVATSPEVQLERLRAAAGKVPESVLPALVASAILNGVTPEDATAAAFPSSDTAPTVNANANRFRAREEAPYKRFNSDGGLNLGSGEVAAGVGVFHFAQRIIKASIAETGEDLEITLPLIERYASILLSIADNAQVRVYGAGQPDRLAGSHTRARGILIDYVENSAHYPVIGEGDTADYEWAKRVEDEVVERFNLSIRISQSGFNFHSLNAEAEKKQRQDAVSDALSGLAVFNPVGPGNPTGLRPETVQSLREMAKGFGVQAQETLPLFRYTFGTGMANEVEDGLIAAFVTHYNQHGADNFRQILNVLSQR